MLAEKMMCTGCGACAVCCPLNCIEMRADQEGFRYPVIDPVRCIGCNTCENTCAVLSKPPLHAEPKAHGVKNKNFGVRKNSSSGGVFPALASLVLDRGGAVCGAAFVDDFSVEHRIVETLEEIRKLQGAKYVQSRTEHLFPEIRSILEANRWLLFVGTPCQVAGLKSYLGKDYEKLILVDMICHGVPSPKVWKRYLLERNQLDAADATVTDVNLRSKESGWSHYSYSVSFSYSNGKNYSTPQGEDPFMKGFVNNLYLRPSCSHCSNKGERRCSDMSLGDFWGIWDIYPEFDDNRGTSLLLIHSEQGRKMRDAISGAFDVCDVALVDALAQNPSALISSASHPLRQAFFEKINDDRVVDAINSCLTPAKTKPSLLQRVWRRIRR